MFVDFSLDENIDSPLPSDEIFYDNKYMSLDYIDKLNKTIIMVSVSDALGGINNQTKAIHI